MTQNVFGGTLNLAQPIKSLHFHSFIHSLCVVGGWCRVLMLEQRLVTSTVTCGR